MEEIKLDESTIPVTSIVKPIVKKNNKFQRWMHAVKNPSDKTIITNMLAWSGGMAVGLFGGVIMLLWVKQWVWAFTTFCGFMLTFTQTRSIAKQYVGLMASLKNTPKIDPQILKANENSLLDGLK